MDDAAFFRDALNRRFPAAVWAGVEERYRLIAPDVAFARTSKNPMDRRLGFCAYFLATIQELEQRGENVDAIRETCLAVTYEYVLPKNGLHRWLKGLPGKLLRTPLVRLFTGWMQAKVGKKGHVDGFLVQVVTAAAETQGLRFGFDIVECGIVKLFRKHGAAHYVSILCEVDELTSSMAGLELLRKGTIARGAERCDFRYRIR